MYVPLLCYDKTERMAFYEKKFAHQRSHVKRNNRMCKRGHEQSKTHVSKCMVDCVFLMIFKDRLFCHSRRFKYYLI